MCALDASLLLLKGIHKQNQKRQRHAGFHAIVDQRGSLSQDN